jgi:acetyl-CoA carboxylase carboxyl transferase subunit alpha
MHRIQHPLEFERELVALEEKIEELKEAIAGGQEDLTSEYAKLEDKIAKLRVDVYSKLSSYERVQLSRHFDRPFALDFIELLFKDFFELHGDRAFRDDPAIVGGTAMFGDQPVMVVGHQRGRSTAERVKRNFGMAQPEGYRKAQRLFRMAERFNLPLITLIDTQGAYPGIEAEERGQAEAIASSLLLLSSLQIPTISVVIGEGGSGGALALGLTDSILMLENACYSVITPEGCASILWKEESANNLTQYATLAADALQLTAQGLNKLGVIDGIVKEPQGGAHRSPQETAENLRTELNNTLIRLLALSKEELIEQRYQKYRNMGVFT